jgi:hypothetical protein
MVSRRDWTMRQGGLSQPALWQSRMRVPSTPIVPSATPQLHPWRCECPPLASHSGGYLVATFSLVVLTEKYRVANERACNGVEQYSESKQAQYKIREKAFRVLAGICPRNVYEPWTKEQGLNVFLTHSTNTWPDHQLQASRPLPHLVVELEKPTRRPLTLA